MFYAVSRDSRLGTVNKITYFSMGAGTSISQESYDRMTMYITDAGSGTFLLGEEPKNVFATPGTALIVPEKTLCGMQTENGLVYTEIIFEKENIMNANVKTNEVFALKDLISYEEGSIANMDVASNPSMKYVLMAFDEGTGLTPHRAPGNAIVFALEGKATIGYEGTASCGAARTTRCARRSATTIRATRSAMSRIYWSRKTARPRCSRAARTAAS